MNMKRIIPLTMIALLVIVMSSCAPEDKTMKAVISTSFGDMTVELYDETPQHRDNFVKLVEDGFYDGLLFHRIIPNFMVQGGDPKSKDAAQGARLGSGGPGYTIPAEIQDTLLHVRGALSAARQPDSVNPMRASSGSQFYVVTGTPHTPQTMQGAMARTGRQYTEDQLQQYYDKGGYPYLDGDYTVFGRVIGGLDVLDKIQAVETDKLDRPLEDVKMTITMK